MLIFLIIVSAAIVIIEGIPLFKKRRYKEFTTVISIVVIALGMWILNSMGLPTSLRILNDLLNPIGKTIFRN